jgi:hypothetical protein
MFLRSAIACCALAVSAGCGDSSTSPEGPPPLPDPNTDQVGLPVDYATALKPFYVFDRPDNRQVRVVFANDVALAGQPFARGSIMVMETYRAKADAQGAPILGPDGRYERDALLGIFVMRKEQWFGRRYKDLQTGEWEYASYRADKTPNVVGDAAGAACSACHLDAGPSRDWVYRADIHFAGASGAIPTPPSNQPADQPFVLNYTFVPATTTINVGTRVTWTNNDQVKHTVTAVDGTFSGFMTQSASFSRVFSTAGTFNYFCAVHPNMRASVVVVQP